jgi:CheY-like chemotaxis protein
MHRLMPPAAPKKVLLVETDVSRQTEILSVLRAINSEVLTASSQKEALITVQKNTPDLMLITVEEDVDPTELSKRVRKASPVQRFPLVLMSPSANIAKRLSDERQKSSNFDAFIPLPTPMEDIVDWVERLIGLPPPPNGSAPPSSSFQTSTTKAREADQVKIRELRREVESLQEQVYFYQKQMDQLSVVGEKENREIDLVLGDLQEDLERTKKEAEQLREELRLVKDDLATKDRQITEKDQALAHSQAELVREGGQLTGEMEGLRRVLHETKEQHKKAQSALREYYKAKLDKHLNRETTIREMDARLQDLSEQLARAQEEGKKLAGERDHQALELDKLTGEVERLKKEEAKLRLELITEQQRAKKAKETLAALSKALE